MEKCNYCSANRYLIPYTIKICFPCLKYHKQYHNETYNFWKDKQDAEYLNAIGECYFYGIFVNEDYSEALKWYNLSTEQGNVSAQYNLGYMYNSGFGVKKNYQEVLKWYTLSAQQGYAYAQNNLGNMYKDGIEVEKNYQEALKLYTLSAQQSNASAQYNLDILLQKIPEEEKLWYARNYKNEKYHDENDNYHMAICYFKGIFVKKNKNYAYELFKSSKILKDKNGILFDHIKDTLNNILIKDLSEIILEFYLK